MKSDAAPRCRRHRTYVQGLWGIAGLGNGPGVGGFGFQFVCAGCLTSRGVLESPELPETCPRCGLRDPWTGPVARERFNRRVRPELPESPFYMGAQSAPHQDRFET